MQMSGLTVQNFVSRRASAWPWPPRFARGLARSEPAAGSATSGPTWSARVVRVLLPLVAGRGASSWSRSAWCRTSPARTDAHAHRRHADVTGGPVASQEAIKELGTNGGGFYNANSAHPFENPNPFTNLLEIYLLLLLPFAMAWAFGLLVGDRRQGCAVVAVMACCWSSRWPAHLGRDGRPRHGAAAAGAAMEGKEVRFGEAASALFAAATTMTSTGAVNSMHDSLTAPGGGVAMFDMMLGEIAPGGVGSGLYGMVDAGHRHGVPGRADGRPHPGVPRQEDRPARDRPGRRSTC